MKSLHLIKKRNEIKIPTTVKNIIRGMIYVNRSVEHVQFKVILIPRFTGNRSFHLYWRQSPQHPWNSVQSWDASYYRSFRYLAEFDPTRVMEISFA
jgi:hypothetical protein